MNRNPFMYGICRHCNESVCSISLVINQHPVHTNDGPVIDVMALVNRLPRELIVKIYNEYFRPVKFYQMYQSITTDTMYLDDTGYHLNKAQFVRHVHIFAFREIAEYIGQMDGEFQVLLTSLKERGYVSAFRLIPEIGPAAYLELLMGKYH